MFRKKQLNNKYMSFFNYPVNELDGFEKSSRLIFEKLLQYCCENGKYVFSRARDLTDRYREYFIKNFRNLNKHKIFCNELKYSSFQSNCSFYQNKNKFYMQIYLRRSVLSCTLSYIVCRYMYL